KPAADSHAANRPGGKQRTSGPVQVFLIAAGKGRWFQPTTKRPLVPTAAGTATQAGSPSDWIGLATRYAAGTRSVGVLGAVFSSQPTVFHGQGRRRAQANCRSARGSSTTYGTY